MDFLTLQGKVADWLNVTNLTAQIPDFINMALHDIEGDWNYKCMEVRMTTSTADAYITMPPGYKDTKWFKVLVDTQYRNLAKDSSDNAIANHPDLTNGTGPPEVFSTMTSSSEFLVRPTPDTTYTFEGIFYCYTADLSNNTDTNWWTINSWEALLFGALFFAAPFIKDDPRVATWKVYYDAATKALRDAESNENIGGSPPTNKASFVV